MPLLLAIIAILLVGGGAYVYTQSKQANQPATTSSPTQATSTTQTSNSKTDWKTYTDTQYGFSVDYPSDWIAKSSEGSTELGGIMYVTFGPTNSVNEKAALEVYPNQDSLDSLLKKFGYDGVWVDTTLDGVPAKEIIIPGGQDTNGGNNTKRAILILSVRNSYGYRLSSTGYEDNVDRVIKMGETFHFIPITPKNPNTAPANQTTSSNPSLKTYNNFGINFQYPVEWGVPKESFYGNGFWSISFDNGSSNGQSFDVFMQQDTNPQGTGLLNETLDQMIARFRTNNKNIYQVKNISTNGVQGRELFYNSAVTGQPYHVDAYFPFQNNSYISFGADYQSVSQATFDSIISTLKWNNATAFKLDSATGMAIYSNNGIRFEYPVKFNTDYASLSVQTSIGKVDSTKLDSNGCYPAINGSGKPSASNVITVNGVKFCSITSGDVGAGQLYTDYSYMTVRNGNAYTIDYSVHTSNGCGVYKNSPDLNAPENAKYNECLNAQGNFGSTVVKPIQDSISTFTFTN